MNTPTKVSADQFCSLVESFIGKQCVTKDSQISCKKCGTAIKAVQAYMSLHDIGFAENCAGRGEVRRLAIPFCPQCESTPSETGCLHVDNPEMKLIEAASRVAPIFNGHSPANTSGFVSTTFLSDLPDQAPKPKRPMGKLMDFIHEFKGFGTHESKCRVRVFANVNELGKLIGETKAPADDMPQTVYTPETRIVVVMTEMGEGTSVTNAAEQIATEVLPMLVPFPELRRYITWIEHYPEHGSAPPFRSHPGGETLDLVSFTAYDSNGPYYARNRWKSGFSGVTWRKYSRAEFHALLGTEVEL